MAGVIGQALPKGTFYSPWFPSQGNGAEMTLDIISINGTNTSLTVTVQTKTSEQSDAAAGSNSSWANSAQTATGKTTWSAGATLDDTTNEGFFELVRFEFTVTSDDDTGNVFCRMLNPSWYSH